MKVILKEDVVNLGEEGDVKTVKDGYARNYLVPRGFALPFTKGNIKIFEARKEIIAKKKDEKRKAAMGIKEKLESLSVVIPMPAGENGRLFGSVNNAVIADLFAKEGIQVERKRIEMSEHNIKTVGKFSVKVRLYENEIATVSVTIIDEKTGTEKKQDSESRTKTAAKVKVAEKPVEEVSAVTAETVSEAPATENVEPEEEAEGLSEE